MAPGECWEGQAEGKLKFELDQVSIEVASGTGDVQSLFSQLDQCKNRQQELLAELQLDDLAAVEAADRAHRELVNEEQNTKQLYEAALQGKTETAWAEEIAALEAIPLTRAVTVLDDERNKALTRKAEIEVNQVQVLKNVDKWRTEYTDLDTLTTCILDKAAELQKTQTELANLPQLPEGYETVSAYLADLSDKEQRQSEMEASLSKLKVEQAALNNAATKHSAEELRDAWESKEREFRRQKENGEALRRVRSKLQQIVEERGNENPMKSLETSIARRFQELTCGAYARVKLDGGAPVEVTGKIPLEAELLSQGTRGSLALATRLALAELYLDGMEGFLVLDDPFTDMDPARRRAAEHCLGEFAKQRQVIFFTCHPDHAREMEEFAGAKAPVIVG
jgi:ABC-type transport system involved in cytochrome c biogenesis ATPase subunit